MLFFCGYRGFTIISFISIVMASTVMGTCGWILLVNQFRTSPSKAAANNETEIIRNSSSTGNSSLPIPLPSLCQDDTFRERFLRYCAITVVVSVSQLLTAIYLLLSQPQECRVRGKAWLVLNLFLNLVYFELVIFLATSSTAINEDGEKEDGGISPLCIDKRTSPVADYLSSFYIATVTCFGSHYLSVIFILLLLKCHQDQYLCDGYSLIAIAAE